MTGSNNRQWILDARPTGNLTGKEFRWTWILQKTRETLRLSPTVECSGSKHRARSASK